MKGEGKKGPERPTKSKASETTEEEGSIIQFLAWNRVPGAKVVHSPTNKEDRYELRSLTCKNGAEKTNLISFEDDDDENEVTATQISQDRKVEIEKSILENDVNLSGLTHDLSYDNHGKDLTSCDRSDARRTTEKCEGSMEDFNEIKARAKSLEEMVKKITEDKNKEKQAWTRDKSQLIKRIMRLKKVIGRDKIGRSKSMTGLRHCQQEKNQRQRHSAGEGRDSEGCSDNNNNKAEVDPVTQWGKTSSPRTNRINSNQNHHFSEADITNFVRSAKKSANVKPVAIAEEHYRYEIKERRRRRKNLVIRATEP